MEDLEKVSLSKALEAEQIKNEQLTAEVELLRRSKTAIAEELKQYNGEFGIHNHFKEMFIKMIEQHEVTDALVAVLEQELPNTEDLVSRVDELEYDLGNKPDEYEITDTVVESITFESRVEDIITDKLNEVKFKLTIEEE